MNFNSKAGHEIRTWILFFVGIALAIIFALKGNPLNPWWTLVIGTFTCTAVIVSAVQGMTGGMNEAARRVIEDSKRDDPSVGPKEKDEPSLSIAMGPRKPWLVGHIRHRHSVPIQPNFG